jgi:hypothetical protein
MQHKNVHYDGPNWYKISSVASFCNYNNEPISLKKEISSSTEELLPVQRDRHECGLKGLKVYS